MKTNANANVSHHVKSAHHVVKKTHELFKNSKICNYTNALILILILSITILATQMYLNNKSKVIPEAEIRFTELSKDKKILGTIMPASCESAPFYVSNGDGNFTGCATVTCWNGAVVMPAQVPAGQEPCPPYPAAIPYLSSYPSSVAPGGYFNLSFSSSYASQCQMYYDNRGNGVGWDGDWNAGTSYTWPYNSLQAWEPIVYGLICYNATNGWSPAVFTMINITPPPTVNIYFQ